MVLTTAVTEVAIVPYERAEPVSASFSVCLLWSLAVFSNCLVCLVIHRSRRLQSTTNYFVVTLAAIDLCLSAACVPFMLGDYIVGYWVFGGGMCRIVSFLLWVAPVLTMFILVSICIDRFYTILYPLSFKVTRGSAKRMIRASIVLAVILTAPMLYFFKAKPSHYGVQCVGSTGDTWGGMVYLVLVCVLSYFIPIMGMVVGYTRVFRYIWRMGSSGRAFQRTMNPVPQSKVKMIKLIIIVNVAIILLLLPWFVMHIVQCVRYEKYIDSATNTAVFIVYYSTTVAKPLIYIVLNANFRRGCKEVFCMSAMKCYRSNAYTITAPSKMGKMNHIGVVTGEPVPEQEMRRLDSPTKTFNRAAILKTAWPSDDVNSNV